MSIASWVLVGLWLGRFRPRPSPFALARRSSPINGALALGQRLRGSRSRGKRCPAPTGGHHATGAQLMGKSDSGRYGGNPNEVFPSSKKTLPGLTASAERCAFASRAQSV